MADRSIERRRYKRYDVGGIHGDMYYLSGLNVINISVDGAAIETKRLEIGREYTFRVDYKDNPLCLKGLVVWSMLTHADKIESGELIPIYRAGVKFTDTMDKKADILLNFIEDNRVKTLERRFRGVRCKIVPSKNIKVDYPYGYDVKKMSLSGMEIETEYPFNPGSEHDMELILNKKVLNIKGKITNCMEVTVPLRNFTKYNMGVKFVKISDVDRKLLKSFLDTLEQS